MNNKRSFVKKIRGQGMTEYIIMVALIAIAAIAIVETFGQSMRVQFGKITSSLQGNPYRAAEFNEVTTRKTGEKTLKNFSKK